MKKIMNFLAILALLAALLGGTTGNAHAEVEPTITGIHFIAEPSIAGFPNINAYADFGSAGSSFTCTVDYGDDSGVQDGTVVGNNRCYGPEHIYTAAGNYTATFTVKDKTDPLFPLIATKTEPHTVVTPYVESVISTIGTVTDANNALGEKDGSYATFGTAGGAIKLGMGAVAADADLTLHHTAAGPSCQVTGLLLFSPDVISLGSTVRGATSTVFSLPPYFQSLTVTCPAVKKGTFGLDAVQVAPSSATTRYGLMFMPMNNLPANPTAALGAPDAQYATFTSGQSLTLVLGLQPLPQGRLTIYHATAVPVCKITVGEIDGASWDLGNTTSGAATSVYTITEPINTVQVDCSALGAGEVFSLDALEFELVTVPEGHAKHAAVLMGAVLNPDNAIWAPDGKYAQFDPAGGALRLDMGASVHGTLTLYYAASSTSCGILASPIAELVGGYAVMAGYTTPGTTISTFTTPNDFQYVFVYCESSFGLDAVKVDTAAPAKWYAALPYQNDQAGILATGAPDGQYVLFGSNPSPMVWDMGAAFHGTLTFHYTASTSGCVFMASMFPEFSLGTLVVEGGGAPGATTQTFTSPNDFRYVFVVCGEGEGLDAVEVDPAPPSRWYATMPVIGDGSSGAATGAPNGTYAPALIEPDPLAWLVLDMGAPVHGLVTIYHTPVSETCLAESTDSSGTVIAELSLLSPNATSTTFYAPDDFQYITFVCANSSSTLEVDALEVVPGDNPLDGYAITVLSADPSVKNAAAALDAPDGSHATIPAATGVIYFDLGALFSGLLTITHASGNPACDVYGGKDILDLNSQSPLGSILSGLPYTIFPISTTTFPNGLRYVMINCQYLLSKGSLSLDAVGVQPAPTPTRDGLIVIDISGTIKNQAAALGKPDGNYATIGYPGGRILLYLGELYTGSLTIYHSTTSPVCYIYGSNGLETAPLGLTTAEASSSTIELPTGIMYAGVYCPSLAKKTSFQLDAVQVVVP